MLIYSFCLIKCYFTCVVKLMSRLNMFLTLYMYLWSCCWVWFVMQLRLITVIMYTFRFKKRSSYFFCVFTFIPMEFVSGSWVANGAPYHFVLQSWIDLLFFISVFHESVGFLLVHGIVYNFYLYLISIVYLTTVFDFILYSGLWIFIWYGGFILANCLTLFLFFLFISLSLYIIDTVFKVPIAGLVMLSREFLALEDEDMWISSNIFHMDVQLRKAKDFIVPLKTKEIEAFMTLTRLFFDKPLRNLQYNVFSNEFAEFRSFQRGSFTERKRVRELTRALMPRHKFMRFRKPRSGVGAVGALLDSQQGQFLDKTSVNLPRSNANIRFYKFLTKYLKFYYLKPPVERKRRKRALLFRYRIDKQRLLGSRFKDRAMFRQKLNFVQGVNLTTKRLAPAITESVSYMQPKVLRNDFVQPYLIPRVNLKDFIFGSGYDMGPYNQLQKIPRFRRFFWFSLPFYISDRSFYSRLVYSLTTSQRFLSIVGNWIRSTFLSPFFAIFEDSWAMGQFRIRNYSINKMSLSQFIKSNNLSVIPFGDNPEDTDDNPASPSSVMVTQQVQSSLSQGVLAQVSDKFRGGKSRGKRNQTKGGRTESERTTKAADSGKEKKESEKMKQKKRLKKKAYRKRLKRKRGTTKRNLLISRQRYYFSNIGNVAGIYGPELRLLHLYKLLEYFYFVLTNDADFYEVAMFSAKVASLRDKYGHVIVADLLRKADHKQAAKVSVKMHVSDTTKTSDGEVLGHESQSWEIVNSDKVRDTNNVLTENLGVKHLGFRNNAIKSFPRMAGFSRDLLLSYRYRSRF